jgi:predicted Rossmann-fold nucleotide-binding protein
MSDLHLSQTPVINVAIFAGGRSPHDEAILRLAQEWCISLATYSTSKIIVVLYGGGDSGVMKVVADAIPPGRLVSIHSHQISDKSFSSLSSCPKAVDSDAENSLWLATTAARKQRLVEDVDFVVCFPGGLGTLDELFTTVEQKKEGALPRLRSVFLVGGPFWDGVKQQLATCVAAKFIQPKHIAIVHFEATVEDLRRELSTAAAPDSPMSFSATTRQHPPFFRPIRVTVIIPTIGRSTLNRALLSAAESAHYARERLRYPSASLFIDFIVCVDCHRRQVNLQHQLQDDSTVTTLLPLVSEMTRQVTMIGGGPRILINNRTPGLAGTMNTALMALVDTTGLHAISSSELHYIAVLDDDDEWEKPYLHRLLLKIISAVCGTASEADDTGSCNIPLWLTTSLVRRPAGASPSGCGNKVLRPSLGEVTIKSFLVGNPGIQGSNTFVELGLLLKAGMYDERLSSATDRDLCLRLLLLKAVIAIIDEPLVIHHVDATDCSRLSNPQNPAKRIGLAMFWAKWQKLMTPEIKYAFFQRCQNYFGFSKKQIVDAAREVLSSIPEAAAHQKRLVDSGELEKMRTSDASINQKQPRLVVLFASHDLANVNALLANLAECNKALVEGGRGCAANVIILLNGDHVEEDRLVVPDDFSLVCIDQACGKKILAETAGETKEPQQVDEVDHPMEATTAAAVQKGKKFEIAESRCILHHVAHTLKSHYDRFLFLDDDKLLDPLFFRRCVHLPADLCDVALGSDNFAPPVPSMSTWRCQLVSFVHALLEATSSSPPNNASNQDPDFSNQGDLSACKPPALKASVDSYYDLSLSVFDHLEFDTSFAGEEGSPLLDEGSIEEILAKIVCGVPCFPHREADATVLSDGPTIERGGCCLVLNPAFLLPFPTPSLNGHPTRRSDFVWALYAMKYGGAKILRLASLAVKHKRHTGQKLLTASDLVSTLLKDTIGSVLYRSCFSDKEEECLQMRLTYRTRQVVASCHRAAGCLDIIEDIIRPSLSGLSSRGIEAVAVMREAIGKVLSFNWTTLTSRSGASLVQGLSTVTTLSADLIKEIKVGWAMAFLPRCDGGRRVDCYEYVGSGHEGRVFRNKTSGLAFKVFYRPTCIEQQCLQLIEPQLRICNAHTISYPFIPGTVYCGRHGTALFRLGCRLYKLFQVHQIVFWDVKPQNLILSSSGGEGEKLSIIDYGTDWKAGQTVECFEGSLRRLWACFLFGLWEENKLRELLRRCRREKDPPEEFGSGYSTFRTAVLEAETNDAGYGPDEAISRWISTQIELLVPAARRHQPIHVLDYGCGNAKLVQAWAQKFPSVQFTAFDPEGPSVWAKHADSRRVRFVTNVTELGGGGEHDEEKGGYDLIILSRVLCVIADDDEAQSVLSHARSMLKMSPTSSVAIVTCLSTTHTRHMCDCPSPMFRSKLGYPSGRRRKDFQRTSHHLKRLCATSGLVTILTPCEFLYAVDLNEFQEAPMLSAMTFAPSSDPGRLTSTLLVRCCDQDAQFLYNQLTHLTNALQRHTQFERVMLLVDVPNLHRRPRQFSRGDTQLLQIVVDRLIAERVVDEVIVPTASNICEVNLALFSADLATTSSPPHGDSAVDGVAHHHDGVPFGASLYALLQRVTTDLVLHMDCDMLLLASGGGADDGGATPTLQHDDDHDPIQFATKTFQKNRLAWTISLPIVNKHPSDAAESCTDNSFRFEVRGGWLRLSHVKHVLLHHRPCRDVQDDWSDFLATHWYRWLDHRMMTMAPTTIEEDDQKHGAFFQSLRYSAGPRFGMIHVPNSMKREQYVHHVLLRQVVDGLVCADQQAGFVDVEPTAFHQPLHHCDIVIVVCGKDVSGGVAARCAHGIVAACRALHLDPALAATAVKVGVALILDHTPHDDCLATIDIFRRSFNHHSRASTTKIVLETLTPETRQGCLANLHFAVEHLCRGDETVIVTCDLDDELLIDALVSVWKVFGSNERMLLAAGGAVRTYKGGLALPSLEHVAVVSQENVESGPDARRSPAHRVASRECYAHLRAFRRGHFLRPEVVGCFRQQNGEYWDLANDWAFMVPMALLANAESTLSDDKTVHNFTSPMLLYDRRTVVDRTARETAIAAIVCWICQQQCWGAK